MVHPNGLSNYYVGRPGPYGNMFKLIGDMVYVDASNRRQILDPWIYVCHGDEHLVQDLYRAVITNDFSKITTDLALGMFDIKHWTKKFYEFNFDELKGKNLYCFCPVHRKDGSRFPCHADVLLEIANREVISE
jgi:hypothetical protein